MQERPTQRTGAELQMGSTRRASHLQLRILQQDWWMIRGLQHWGCFGLLQPGSPIPKEIGRLAQRIKTFLLLSLTSLENSNQTGKEGIEKIAFLPPVCIISPWNAMSFKICLWLWTMLNERNSYRVPLREKWRNCGSPNIYIHFIIWGIFSYFSNHREVEVTLGIPPMVVQLEVDHDKVGSTWLSSRDRENF